jgi:predicted nucleic acid-binding Zn ribbon protein
MKKLVGTLALAYIVFCLGLVALFLVFSPTQLLNGMGITSSISIGVFRGVIVYIYSPLNTTYNFNIGSTYTLDLKVGASSMFNISEWKYRLEDLRHSNVVYDNIAFTPNITFNAVRWSNKLTVYANDTTGEVGNASVVFFISVPNSAPILGDIPKELYVCENRYLNYPFTITDVDESALTIDISPKNPIFVYPFYFEEGSTVVTSYFTSSVIGKGQIGFYPEVITVSDGEYADTKRVNITAIEINNLPSLDAIGVKTVWSRGENRTLYIQAKASDFEDGNLSLGNLTINLTFYDESPFFNISNKGVINWIANSTYIGVHNIKVCVFDKPISYIHPNISLCSNTGLSQADCENFSLTVTDENRAPYFISYSPTSLNFSTLTSQYLLFYVATYDPDGTVPDIYWYLNNAINASKYTSGNSTDSFNYTFNCNETGLNNLRIVITDGLLNASLTWLINVTGADCAEAPQEGGGAVGGGGAAVGGGAGPAPNCTEKWVCFDWYNCQNLDFSFGFGNITRDDYEQISTYCSMLDILKSDCGYQIRKCIDLNKCNSSRIKPQEIQSCYFTMQPSCFDGIKNCHDGACEILTDCGGPCSFCPTCSDKIKNQREEGIDCGGPCPNKCMPEQQLQRKTRINYSLIILTSLILVIVFIIIVKVVQIIRLRKEARNLAWYRLR